MGNIQAVQAASAPPPPTMPPPPPGMPPPPSAGSEKSENAQFQPPMPLPQDPSSVKNPGTMEDLHKQCKDVFPTNFEGAKLMVNKGLSNHFQVSHTINLSSETPSGYRFGATYVGTKQFTSNEAFPILLGDIDPSGDLNANIIHQFTPRLKTKFATQVKKSKFNAIQMTADYKGSDYTFTATAANPDIINESGVLVGHYLQSVSKNTDLGAELAYQYGPQVPGGEIAVLSIAGRYSGKDYVFSGTAGMSALHLCYFQKASEQLALGVEFDTNFRMMESTASLAYQIDVPKADLSFKGMVDTNWTIGGVLEKKLAPLPFSFALSGLLNHSNSNFRLGCGLMIG